MKPTQEQVIAWALDTGCWETDSGELVVDEMNLTRFATLAYEAGRKDDNEACAELIPPQYFELRDRIRARMEP